MTVIDAANFVLSLPAAGGVPPGDGVRLRPVRWPRAGEGFVIRSGLKSVGPKVRNIVHWVLDPATGRPWWTMEGVAAPMDLDARKLAVVDAKTLSDLEAACVDGLAC